MTAPTIALNISPYFRCGGCNGLDLDAWTADDRCEVRWLFERLALASEIPNIKAVLLDQECIKTITPTHEARLRLLESLVAMYLPEAAVFLYMNGGHIYNNVPAYELIAGSARNLRWYDQESVRFTEGLLDQCEAKYPGVPKMVTISLVAGYTTVDGKRTWVVDAGLSVDHYWRLGRTIGLDDRINFIWLFPGAMDPGVARWLPCFVAFTKGMAGQAGGMQ